MIENPEVTKFYRAKYVHPSRSPLCRILCRTIGCGIVSTNWRVDVTQRHLNNVTVLFWYYKPVSSILLLSKIFNSVPYDGL